VLVVSKGRQAANRQQLAPNFSFFIPFRVHYEWHVKIIMMIRFSCCCLAPGSLELLAVVSFGLLRLGTFELVKRRRRVSGKCLLSQSNLKLSQMMNEHLMIANRKSACNRSV